jgi:hypothetical protein
VRRKRRRRRDLHSAAAPQPNVERPIGTRRVSRKLRLLRAHGIIRKVSGIYRCQLTEIGRKAITALLPVLRSTVRELLPEAALKFVARNKENTD